MTSRDPKVTAAARTKIDLYYHQCRRGLSQATTEGAYHAAAAQIDWDRLDQWRVDHLRRHAKITWDEMFGRGVSRIKLRYEASPNSYLPR